MSRLFSSTAAVLAAATTFLGAVTADLCSEGADEYKGNWYCQEVTTIQYTGLGAPGSYNRITSMDSTTGGCGSYSYAYSGSLAPLDEEVSMHFRGPLDLKSFAVYVPSGSSAASKAKVRKAKRSAGHEHDFGHGHAHGHSHFHKRNKEVREAQEKVQEEKRQWPEVWVTAVIDGKTVSWINNYHPGHAEPTPAAAGHWGPPTVASVPAKATTLVTSVAGAGTEGTSTFTPAAQPTSSAVSSGDLPSGSWEQTAFYEASSGTSSGLTFLNHYGGIGSGVFDYVFGNSLSYASSDGCTGASGSTTLDDITIPSGKEIVIMTDTSCADEEGCDYSRPGTVAYHGFDGAEKIFLMEFGMPSDGSSGWGMDMPAIWMLNAQIPRTMQYGQSDCSCWLTGCGELDLFEVLDSGDYRMKSTFHGNNAGGDSDYFMRPTNGTIKAAVVMNGETATIKILSENFDMASSLSEETVQQLASTSWSDVGGKVSTFNLN